MMELFQAVRKLNDAKKLESSAHYSAYFGKRIEGGSDHSANCVRLYSSNLGRKSSHPDAMGSLLIYLFIYLLVSSDRFQDGCGGTCGSWGMGVACRRRIFLIDETCTMISSSSFSHASCTSPLFDVIGR